MLNKGDYVWIPDIYKSDPSLCIGGVIVDISTLHYTISDEFGKTHLIDTTKDLKVIHPSCIEPVEDMTYLGELTQGAILRNIHLRYQKDEIYTYCGKILVAVNPYKRLPIYSYENMLKYRSAKINELSPHLYAVGNEAISNMKLNRKNQCIIISGESGAGKTESTKQILQFLAKISGHYNDLEKRIMESHPVLEAFGNAKTIRNDNSSRFGKYIDIEFCEMDHKDIIIGARIEAYLLEKSRLVNLNKSEKNYHIFYYLLNGVQKNPTLSYLGIDPKITYAYLNPIDEKASKYTPNWLKEDEMEFINIQNSLQLLGFSSEEMKGIWRQLAAILHLGNVNFSSVWENHTETSHVKRALLSIDNNDENDAFSYESLKWASNLLRVPIHEIHNALTLKRLYTGGECVTSRRTRAQAIAIRDSLVKYIYSALFGWLIERINESIKDVNLKKNSPNQQSETLTNKSQQCPSCKLFSEVNNTSYSENHQSVGVLDIFGFENFDSNSFEQFCINLANESLHQFFVNHVFKLEQEEYKNELLDYKPINFEDNQETISLLSTGSLNILSLINDESSFPQGSDSNLLQKIVQIHRNNPRLLKPMSLQVKKFGVQHFSGIVYYNMTGFMEKNRDIFHSDLYGLISQSKCSFVQHIFNYTLLQSEESMTDIRKKPTSLSVQFRKSLNKLMSTLQKCDPLFIRCIKPNNQKICQKFDPILCAQQLKYSGMYATIEIRKCGYPVRYKFKEFNTRFKLLLNTMKTKNMVDRDITRSICQTFLTNEDYQMGKTKVYLKHFHEMKLELAEEVILSNSAKVIQKNWKIYKQHKASKTFREIVDKYRENEIQVLIKAKKLDDERFLKSQQLNQEKNEQDDTWELTEEEHLNFCINAQSICRRWLSRYGIMYSRYADSSDLTQRRKILACILYNKSLFVNLKDHHLLKLKDEMSRAFLVEYIQFLENFQEPEKAFLLSQERYQNRIKQLLSQVSPEDKIQEKANININEDQIGGEGKSSIMMEEIWETAYWKFAKKNFINDNNPIFQETWITSALLEHKENHDKIASLVIWEIINRLISVFKNIPEIEAADIIEDQNDRHKSFNPSNPLQFLCLDGVMKPVKVEKFSIGSQKNSKVAKFPTFILNHERQPLEQVFRNMTQSYSEHQIKSIHKFVQSLTTRNHRQKESCGIQIKEFHFKELIKTPLDYFLVQLVCAHGLLCESLRDEIYCQIMKQLICNPSGESQQKAWLLLYIFVGIFQPSKPDLVHAVRNFIVTLSPTNEFLNLCLKRFDLFSGYSQNESISDRGEKILRPNSRDPSSSKYFRQSPPSQLEIEVLQNGQESDFSIKIFLMDDRDYNIDINCLSNCEEVLKNISSRINLNDTFGFALFISIGDSVSSLGNVNIMDVFYRCEKYIRKVQHLNMHEKMTHNFKRTDKSIVLNNNENVICQNVSWKFFLRKEIFAPWHQPTQDPIASDLICSQIFRGLLYGEYQFDSEEKLAWLLAYRLYIYNKHYEPFSRFSAEQVRKQLDQYLREIPIMKFLFDHKEQSEKGSNDLIEKWTELIFSQYSIAGLATKRPGLEKAQADIVNFTIKYWPYSFSKYFNVKPVDKFLKDLIKDDKFELFIQINCKGIQLILETHRNNEKRTAELHEDDDKTGDTSRRRVTIKSFCFIEFKSFSVPQKNCLEFNLYNGLNFRFDTIVANDIAKLLTYILDQLVVRSRYAVALRDYGKKRNLLKPANYLIMNVGDVLQISPPPKTGPSHLTEQVNNRLLLYGHNLTSTRSALPSDRGGYTNKNTGKAQFVGGYFPRKYVQILACTTRPSNEIISSLNLFQKSPLSPVNIQDHQINVNDSKAKRPSSLNPYSGISCNEENDGEVFILPQKTMKCYHKNGPRDKSDPEINQSSKFKHLTELFSDIKIPNPSKYSISSKNFDKIISKKIHEYQSNVRVQKGNDSMKNKNEKLNELLFIIQMAISKYAAVIQENTHLITDSVDYDLMMKRQKYSDAIFVLLSDDFSDQVFKFLFQKLLKYEKTNRNLYYSSWKVLWIMTGIFSITKQSYNHFVKLFNQYIERLTLQGKSDKRQYKTKIEDVAKSSCDRLKIFYKHPRILPVSIFELTALEFNEVVIPHKIYTPQKKIWVEFELKTTMRVADVSQLFLNWFNETYPFEGQKNDQRCQRNFGVYLELIGYPELFLMPDDFYIFDIFRSIQDFNNHKVETRNIFDQYSLIVAKRIWINVVPGQDLHMDYLFHYPHEVSSFLSGQGNYSQEETAQIAACISLLEDYDSPIEKSLDLTNLIPMSALRDNSSQSGWLYRLNNIRMQIIEELTPWQKSENFEYTFVDSTTVMAPSSEEGRDIILKNILKFSMKLFIGKVTFGCQYFDVQYTNSPMAEKNLTLGINWMGLFIINNGQILQSISYPSIKTVQIVKKKVQQNSPAEKIIQISINNAKKFDKHAPIMNAVIKLKIPSTCPLSSKAMKLDKMEEVQGLILNYQEMSKRLSFTLISFQNLTK